MSLTSIRTIPFGIFALDLGACFSKCTRGSDAVEEPVSITVKPLGLHHILFAPARAAIQQTVTKAPAHHIQLWRQSSWQQLAQYLRSWLSSACVSVSGCRIKMANVAAMQQDPKCLVSTPQSIHTPTCGGLIAVKHDSSGAVFADCSSSMPCASHAVRVYYPKP